MKYVALLAMCILLASSRLYAQQEHVTNGNFSEAYINGAPFGNPCQLDQDGIDKNRRNVVGWTSGSAATPDYFRECSTPETFGVPLNRFINHDIPDGTPNSEVSAYAGIYMFDANTIYREYLRNALSVPLESGKWYVVSFKIAAGLDGPWWADPTKGFGAVANAIDAIDVVLTGKADGKSYYQGTNGVLKPPARFSPQEIQIRAEEIGTEKYFYNQEFPHWIEVSRLFKVEGEDKTDLFIGSLAGDLVADRNIKLIGEDLGPNGFGQVYKQMVYAFIDDVSIKEVPCSDCGAIKVLVERDESRIDCCYNITIVNDGNCDVFGGELSYKLIADDGREITVPIPDFTTVPAGGYAVFKWCNDALAGQSAKLRVVLSLPDRECTWDFTVDCEQKPKCSDCKSLAVRVQQDKDAAGCCFDIDIANDGNCDVIAAKAYFRDEDASYEGEIPLLPFKPIPGGGFAKFRWCNDGLVGRQGIIRVVLTMSDNRTCEFEIPIKCEVPDKCCDLMKVTARPYTSRDLLPLPNPCCGATVIEATLDYVNDMCDPIHEFRISGGGRPSYIMKRGQPITFATRTILLGIECGGPDCPCTRKVQALNARGEVICETNITLPKCSTPPPPDLDPGPGGFQKQRQEDTPQTPTTCLTISAAKLVDLRGRVVTSFSNAVALDDQLITKLSDMGIPAGLYVISGLDPNGQPCSKSVLVP
ncbi:MAG: hypothetical protein FGM24_10505 [Candidatus Kapabacteria bacterium]|nr:hypothetical protein [Candidatus Kapabacteria bacterium]